MAEHSLPGKCFNNTDNVNVMLLDSNNSAAYLMLNRIILGYGITNECDLLLNLHFCHLSMNIVQSICFEILCSELMNYVIPLKVFSEIFIQH